MLLQRVLALRGPNLWARFPVLEAWVDLQTLKDRASSEIPGFNDRLKAFLPSLVEHRCSEGRVGGFYERLARGTYLAHILEHVALELQSLAGTPVKYGKTRMTSVDGVYKMAVAYVHEAMGKAAIDAGVELCLAAVEDRSFDVSAAVQRLRAIVDAGRPSAITQAILDVAKQRRIPARLVDKSGLVQLGYGARQRRVLEGQTDASSAVANGIAGDRLLCREMLAAIGVPSPACRLVTSAEDAWAAAEELGLPVVVRTKYVNALPPSGPLDTREAIEAAYRQLGDAGYSTIVEHAAPGDEVRLLVVGSRVVSAFRGSEDVTASLHPRIAERAVDAASVVGLDVASVDVRVADPAKPLEDQAGVVTSVVAPPDFAGAIAAAPERTSALATAVVEHLFSESNKARIPIVSVTGTNGKTTTTRLTAALLSRAFSTVGMCCTEGIYLGERRIAKGDCSGPKSAKAILHHAEPTAAVVEAARGGILREGLGFDRCDVAIVTNIGEGDHLGTSDVDTPEQLAYVKSTIVWAVRPEGFAVLNANDPLTVGMTQWCSGQTIFFALRADHPVIVEHRAKGGRAAFVRNNVMILAEGAAETELIDLARVPLTQGGHVGFHVENALASASAAWAVGVPFEELRAGLAGFAPKMDQIPARFNILDLGGVTVVLDYGHNTSAVARLLEVLAKFPHPRRSVVYSAAGDRRDSDIVAQGEQLGAFFDRVFIYEDTYLRGRREGEITELFKQGMARTERVQEVRSIKGGMLAIEIALSACEPGDLLVIQPDRIDDGVALLKKFVASGGQEISLEDALRRPKPSPDAAGASGGSYCDEPIRVVEGRLGKAVLAARNLKKGELLTQGFGPTTTERSMHTIQIDLNLHLAPPAPMKFFNHSCEPNCGILIRRGADSLEIHALRDLAEGEELTLDYETFEERFEALTGPCLCGTSACRGRLRGYATLSHELRARYGKYVAEYLREPLPAIAGVTVTVPAHADPVVDPAEIPVAAEV